MTWLVFCNKETKLASQNNSMRAFLPSEDNEQSIDFFRDIASEISDEFFIRKDKSVINVAMMKRQGKEMCK